MRGKDLPPDKIRNLPITVYPFKNIPLSSITKKNKLIPFQATIPEKVTIPLTYRYGTMECYYITYCYRTIVPTSSDRWMQFCVIYYDSNI
jgi:hypothetical protein